MLDVTIGLGGHAAALLEAVGAQGRLIGLDADERNLTIARERLAGQGRADLRHANFRDLPTMDLPDVDVLFADLGLSSPHVDNPLRGFTFRFDAPLDLRYDPTRGETAAELVTRSTPEDLFQIFRTFGEFSGGARLGRALAGSTIATTDDLKRVVEVTFGYRAKALLPQIFQALRIAVNDELGALDVLLDAGPKLLKPGGRMGVISYHSLEDRSVKRAFRALTMPPKDPVTGRILRCAHFSLLTRRPLVPSPEEIAANPRARSAKFRALHRH